MDKKQLERTVERAKERNIIIPTSLIENQPVALHICNDTHTY